MTIKRYRDLAFRVVLWSLFCLLAGPAAAQVQQAQVRIDGMV